VSLRAFKVVAFLSVFALLGDTTTLRGKVVNTVTGRGVEGFRVCPTLDGTHAIGPCDMTDSSGRYVLSGIPSSEEVAIRLEKDGWIQYLLHYRTPAEGSRYEKTRTGRSKLAQIALDFDPRHPFSSAQGTQKGHGDVGLMATSGRHPAAGVVFVVWHKGRRYPTAGLYYVAPSRNPFYGGSDVPQKGLYSTVEETGAALMLHLPEGTYEAEALSPKGLCRPSRSSWKGSTPNRGQFLIREGFMSNVKFACP